jgi:acetyltransferase-like isoleucine patch superfamily enzyme
MFMSLLKKIQRKIRKHPLEQYKEYIQQDTSAILLPGSSIRFDTKVVARKYVTIGQKCLIKASFVFETEKGEVIIGNNVHIGGASFISRNRIIVGDDVTMAWDITFYDHNSHSIDWEQRKFDNSTCYEDYLKYGGNNIVNKDWSNVKDAPIVIAPKVWIGFGVTILKGVTIGEGAVIGAKTVVTKNVEAWTVVGGNPAQVIKYLPQYRKEN